MTIVGRRRLNTPNEGARASSLRVRFLGHELSAPFPVCSGFPALTSPGCDELVALLGVGVDLYRIAEMGRNGDLLSVPYLQSHLVCCALGSEGGWVGYVKIIVFSPRNRSSACS